VNLLLVGLIAFIGVATLVGGVAMLVTAKGSSRVEDRLEILTGTGAAATAREALWKEGSLLAHPLDEGRSLVEGLLDRFGNIDLFLEQADTSLTAGRLALICAMFAAAGGVLATAVRVHPALIPLAIAGLAFVPIGWIIFRRKRRLKAFGGQLPDAMEMIGRVLRAGQGLAFGFSVVSEEMANPISKEFNRVFEEQNLGVPLEESLHSLCDRVPNLDLKFFATAVILQRQTGGDLSEILDKIGALIRARFRVWGQIQALTGEGRLSGVVLMALPLVLLVAIYELNPTYIATLFTDPMGKKMLAAAVVMQILGALVIRKIVDIKV
jgi:tight adherence protein B